MERPKRGRWTREQRVTERAACIDIILTQATTGLRTSEVGLRPTRDCMIDKGGNVLIALDVSVTKTNRERRVPVLDPRVSKRLAARIDGPSPWLFPLPSNPAKVWTPRTRDRKVAELYLEMAEKLGIDEFVHERGHIWRATLNTLLADELPEDARIRLLGHTREVNRAHYTGSTDSKRALDAAAMLRESDVTADVTARHGMSPEQQG